MRQVLIALILVFGLTACRDREPAVASYTLTIPPGFFDLDKMKTADDFQKALDSITVVPRRAPFAAKDLRSARLIFQQLGALEEAKQVGTIYLSDSSDLYQSLDATLEKAPGWSILAGRASRLHRVETSSLAAFIAATPGPLGK